MKAWLAYANLSDGYERKARFAPALLTVLFLLPLSIAFSGPLGGWVGVVISGAGAGAVVAVGLSHVASAAGNRLQRRLWPQWPLDSPTNRWLHPNDSSRSRQQKAKWHGEILQLTGLDVADAAAADEEDLELKRVINDAVSKIRYLLRDSPHGDRLRVHNADFGFARNFTGLRVVWLAFAVLSGVGCWLAFVIADGDAVTVGAASLVLVGGIALAVILPGYVRVRADSYAESFFGAMSMLADEQTTRSRESVKPMSADRAIDAQ